MKHWHLSWQKPNLMTFLVKYVQLHLRRFWSNKIKVLPWTTPTLGWSGDQRHSDRCIMSLMTKDLLLFVSADYCAANNILMADPRCENWPPSQTSPARGLGYPVSGLWLAEQRYPGFWLADRRYQVSIQNSDNNILTRIKYHNMFTLVAPRPFKCWLLNPCQ